MSLEGFSKRGMELGNNPEGINETKNDLRQQYLSAIKKLALAKMKNDILFEGRLGATIRDLSSMGLNITKENVIKDIETEVARQKSDLSWNEYVPQKVEEIPVAVVDETKAQIDRLKNNLSSIFESTPIQEQKQAYTTGTIPREPTMQSSENYGVSINNLSQVYEEPIKQTSVHTEKEKQEMKVQLQQAQDELSRTMEKVQEHSNNPTMTFTGNLANLSDDIKQRIIQQMEARGEVIISGIDNIYQEGNYIVVDAKDNQGRFTGTEFTLDDFSRLVNQPSISMKSEEIFQQPIDSNHVIHQPIQPVAEQPQQISQEESKEIIQGQQNQMKDSIINQIISSMNNAGEFAFGDISMGERMSIMQNVQNKLNAKNMEELQMLLSTYQEQNVQEETMNSGMHR